MEVDLDIQEKVICTKVDLEFDDERKIWASCLQRTVYTGHLTDFLGKFIAFRLVGHVLQDTHVVEF